MRGEIVTCGRLTEQKNHAMLINAFAEVQKKYPFATLKIYGDGTLKDKLQKQIDDLGLSSTAHLMGATSDVTRALQTADLFVLSSDYEGMPNALMEAMAAGVPCISTDCPCGGPRELFGEDGSNKLVQCRDVNQMEKAICSVLESTEDGTTEKKHSEIFRPEKVNKMWEKYVMEVTE